MKYIYTAPEITLVNPSGVWMLDEQFSHFDKRNGVTLHVPPLFIFDLASIPKALWWLVAPFELSVAAPLLHDYLYRTQGVLPFGSVVPYRKYTRAEVDRLFLDVMEGEGISPFRRRAAYGAVRSFGWLPWRRANGVV